METIFLILIFLSLLATLGALLTGVLGMTGGKSLRGNIYMRWRIGLQGLTLSLIALYLFLYG